MRLIRNLALLLAGMLVLAGCSSRQEPTPQEQKAQAEAEMKRAARRAALDARSDGPQA